MGGFQSIHKIRRVDLFWPGWLCTPVSIYMCVCVCKLNGLQSLKRILDTVKRRIGVTWLQIMSQAAISDDFNDGEINYNVVCSHRGIDPQTPHKVGQANRCLTQPTHTPHPPTHFTLPFLLDWSVHTHRFWGKSCIRNNIRASSSTLSSSN